jgi:hypothetical protein
MRYPKFHAQGLRTSTGVLEAGCKVAIGTRLKRSGMHRTVNGANAIIALRCSKLSGRFEDFRERRSDRAAAGFHPSNPTCAPVSRDARFPAQETLPKGSSSARVNATRLTLFE